MRRADRITLIVVAVFIVGIWVVALSLSRNRDSGDGYVWRRSQIPIGQHNTLMFPSILVTPTGTIIVGTDNGVFRSTDQGKTWQHSCIGMKECLVDDVLVDQQGLIYAATSGGLSRSNDDGRSWTLVYTSTDTYISCLAVEKNNIYAGTMAGDILVSNDGRQWKPFSRGHIYRVLNSIAVDSRGAVYAGTEGHGIYRTDYNNQRWQNVWMPKAGNRSHTRSMIITSKGDIWAADEEQLLYFNDSSKHWARLQPGSMHAFYNTVALSPKGELAVGSIEGGFLSRDCGKGWIQMDIHSSKSLRQRSPIISAVTFDKASGIYAVSHEGSLFIGTPVKAGN